MTPLLVWDFDGTLADTFVAIRMAADATLVAHGRPPCDPDALRDTVGLTLAEAITRLAGPDLEPPLLASMIDADRAEFSVAGPTHATLFPGVAELLVDLAGQGRMCAVATSRRRVSTEDLLTRFGIAGRFASVHCESDLEPGRGKPNPDLVLAACAAAGWDPADAVVIGDAAVDIGMGRAAGATTVAVTWGHGRRQALVAAGPTHVVDDLDGLRRLLT
jgi:phosphoglycolate phosphatase-like HAD superfamily hydrolase